MPWGLTYSQGKAGSPGSGGTSPYSSLRPAPVLVSRTLPKASPYFLAKTLHNIYLSRQRCRRSVDVKSEDEETHLISHCDIHLPGNRRLRWATSHIFDAGCFSAFRVLQSQRVRNWSLRNVCHRRWIQGKFRQPLLGWRPGCDSLAALEVRGYQIPRDRNQYPLR
jgi:hypothetical protein